MDWNLNFTPFKHRADTIMGVWNSVGDFGPNGSAHGEIVEKEVDGGNGC